MKTVVHMTRHHQIFSQILSQAGRSQAIPRAVVDPVGDEILHLARETAKPALIRPPLIGPRGAIQACATTIGRDSPALDHVDAESEGASAATGMARRQATQPRSARCGMASMASPTDSSRAARPESTRTPRRGARWPASLPAAPRGVGAATTLSVDGVAVEFGRLAARSEGLAAPALAADIGERAAKIRSATCAARKAFGRAHAEEARQ